MAEESDARAALVVALAPLSPPCFASRSDWTGWLLSADIYQSAKDRGGPLVFEKGQPVRFNLNFSYCEDCEPSYRARMLKAGRCDPDYVRKQGVKP